MHLHASSSLLVRLRLSLSAPAAITRRRGLGGLVGREALVELLRGVLVDFAADDAHVDRVARRRLPRSLFRLRNKNFETVQSYLILSIMKKLTQFQI